MNSEIHPSTSSASSVEDTTAVEIENGDLNGREVRMISGETTEWDPSMCVRTAGFIGSLLILDVGAASFHGVLSGSTEDDPQPIFYVSIAGLAVSGLAIAIILGVALGQNQTNIPSIQH